MQESAEDKRTICVLEKRLLPSCSIYTMNTQNPTGVTPLLSLSDFCVLRLSEESLTSQHARKLIVSLPETDFIVRIFYLWFVRKAKRSASRTWIDSEYTLMIEHTFSPLEGETIMARTVFDGKDSCVERFDLFSVSNEECIRLIHACRRSPESINVILIERSIKS